MAIVNLDGVYAKIARGKEHGDTLRQEIDAWFKSGPYKLVTQVNSDRTRWTVAIYHTEPDKRPRWSLVLGDAVNNLRSALDHLFFAVAENYSPGVAVQQRTFPIIGQVERWRKFRAKRVGMKIPESVWAVLESVQPYNRRSHGGISHLELLNRLAVADKHHVLAVLLMPKPQAMWSGLKPGTRFSYGLHGGFMSGANVESGTEVAWISVESPAADMNPEFEVSCTVAVQHATVGNHRTCELGAAMGVLPEAVESVVRRVANAVR